MSNALHHWMFWPDILQFLPFLPVSYLLLFKFDEAANQISLTASSSFRLLVRSQRANWDQFGIKKLVDWHKTTTKDCYYKVWQISITDEILQTNTVHIAQRHACAHPHSCTCLRRVSICRRNIRQSPHICVLRFKLLAPAPTPAHVPLNWVWPRATLPQFSSWVIHAQTSDGDTLL